tara:strand:- start:60 stop:395 length:336 start_codon:yes stop_codon:yes gene_type:complete
MIMSEKANDCPPASELVISHAEYGLKQPYTPDQVREMRNKLGNYAAQMIPMAAEVVSGERTWDRQQVAVFKMFLDKSMPTVEAKMIDKRITVNDLSALSRADLENIANGKE